MVPKQQQYINNEVVSDLVSFVEKEVSWAPPPALWLLLSTGHVPGREGAPHSLCMETKSHGKPASRSVHFSEHIARQVIRSPPLVFILPPSPQGDANPIVMPRHNSHSS